MVLLSPSLSTAVAFAVGVLVAVGLRGPAARTGIRSLIPVPVPAERPEQGRHGQAERNSAPYAVQMSDLVLPAVSAERVPSRERHHSEAANLIGLTEWVLPPAATKGDGEDGRI
jgi:hypothetical protein